MQGGAAARPKTRRSQVSHLEHVLPTVSHLQQTHVATGQWGDAERSKVHGLGGPPWVSLAAAARTVLPLPAVQCGGDECVGGGKPCTARLALRLPGAHPGPNRRRGGGGSGHGGGGGRDRASAGAGA